MTYEVFRGCPVTIKQDSALYNSMLGCEIINRLTEDPPEQEQKKERERKGES